jgi:hypothetical protein
LDRPGVVGTSPSSYSAGAATGEVPREEPPDEYVAELLDEHNPF